MHQDVRRNGFLMRRRPGSRLALAALLAVALTAAGCGAPRLQTPEEVDAVLAKSAEGYNRRECERKNIDASAYFACRQQNQRSYEQWRKERDNAKP
ncbi:hypothetical protein [Massilia sp. TWP1-3-3]|uniref:hypothetical protein n=1 Tax=Massilia sp. TWP1-3-3 TaxID=2804573 RepID=UPI003CF0146F